MKYLRHEPFFSESLTPEGRPRRERVVHKRSAEERARFRRSGETQHRF
jgi:hypothetical protein